MGDTVEQLALFPRRICVPDDDSAPVWGSVVSDWGELLLVRFDGEWAMGSCRGCVLLVDAGELL